MPIVPSSNISRRFTRCLLVKVGFPSQINLAIEAHSPSGVDPTAGNLRHWEVRSLKGLARLESKSIDCQRVSKWLSICVLRVISSITQLAKYSIETTNNIANLMSPNVPHVCRKYLLETQQVLAIVAPFHLLYMCTRSGICAQ